MLTIFLGLDIRILTTRALAQAPSQPTAVDKQVPLEMHSTILLMPLVQTPPIQAFKQMLATLLSSIILIQPVQRTTSGLHPLIVTTCMIFAVSQGTHQMATFT